MARAHLSIALTLFLISQTYQVSSPNDDVYMAAVVEFSPRTFPRPDNMMMNVLAYEEYVKEAATKSVDIIVFPEIGLAGYGDMSEAMFSFVPDPDTQTVPCDGIFDTTEVLGNLSCIAQENKMYMVVNLPEKFPCSKTEDPKCPDRGTYQYNTNVVFDRNGTVIARYRKFHLFGEPEMNITAEPELITFETDFGVTFGTFICFDLMFGEPAVRLVKEMNVTDVVFPTAWFSELPFLSAVQAQSSWSSAMDVNLLASGYNNPNVGSGGSGIYLGKGGPLMYTMPETMTSEMLVAQVPKKGRPAPPVQSQRNTGPRTFFLKKDVLEVYQSVLLNVEKGHKPLREVICAKSGDLCCTFNVEYDNNTVVSHYYRAVVFDGVRTFDSFATGGLQVCGILWCSNEDDLSSCAERSTQFDYTFTSIEIEGEFRTDNTAPMPNTLGAELLPFDADVFSFVTTPQGNVTKVTFKLNANTSELSTFAIYSRDFNRDGDKATTGAASLASLAPWLALFCLYLSLQSSQ